MTQFQKTLKKQNPVNKATRRVYAQPRRMISKHAKARQQRQEAKARKAKS